MPLSIAPTMPRKPWSVPQMNRFCRWVRPSSCLSGAPYTAPLSWPVKRTIVVGVNKFAEPSPATTDVFQLDAETEPRQIQRVRLVRASRSQTEWRAALDAVETAARGATNLVPPIVTAVEARAMLGEIADVMRKVFGEHQDVSPVATAARS